ILIETASNQLSGHVPNRVVMGSTWVVVPQTQAGKQFHVHAMKHQRQPGWNSVDDMDQRELQFIQMAGENTFEADEDLPLVTKPFQLIEDQDNLGIKATSSAQVLDALLNELI